MSATEVHHPSRCAELAVLLDLEARWENLRALRTSTLPSSLQELQSMQRAYEVFHARLVAFNKRYKPVHIPELLINTPVRLEQWCKKLSALFTALGAGAAVPAHLLEKAYRLADALAIRTNRERAARPVSGEARSVAGELEALAAWCIELPDAGAAA